MKKIVKIGPEQVEIRTAMFGNGKFQPNRNGLYYYGADPNSHLGLGANPKVSIGFWEWTQDSPHGSGPRFFKWDLEVDRSPMGNCP